MPEIFCRSAYNYDTDVASAASALVCTDRSRTKQAMKDECDINQIVKRFNLTGKLPENIRLPQYADFEDIFDFHSAMSAVTEARESFERLPSNVRSRFHNDPGEFVDFVSNEANFDEVVKLGLAKPKPVIEPKSEAPAPGDGGGLHSSST